MRIVEERRPPVARVVVVRPIGHPLPLGLTAFSTATGYALSGVSQLPFGARLATALPPGRLDGRR